MEEALAKLCIIGVILWFTALIIYQISDTKSKQEFVLLQLSKLCVTVALVGLLGLIIVK